ncbi:hypothetical protein [Cupriavidus campinensis]
MSDLLEWSEKQALENLRFHIQTAEQLAKDANATLTLLLAGAGGLVAYLVKLLESKADTVWLAAVCAFVITLSVLSATLIFFCIKTAPIAAPTNEPKNIYQPSFSLSAIREVELQNIQVRIDQVARRNMRVATWLDYVRFMAVCSPISPAAVGVLCTVLGLA